jgi:LysR family nitrogen assimilation transcriptional regulator
VEDFTGNYPEVKLRVVVALGGAVREGLLQQGSIDLGVIYGPIDARNLHMHALWEESLVLLSRPEQQPDERPLSFRRLRDLPLILPTGAHGLRSVLERHSEALGHALRSAIDRLSLAPNCTGTIEPGASGVKVMMPSPPLQR